MSVTRAILTASMVFVPGVWLATGSRPVNAQKSSDASPVEVTSDTPQYCVYLQDRVHHLVRLTTAPPPAEVENLSDEGQRMCEHGQTRGGIMRLRKALMIMKHEEPETDLR